MAKRGYQSPRRQEQARRTQQAILTAARRLFVARGFGATTIEAIARSAGVAVQTVYSAFGSKRRMLIALLDRMAAEADLPRLERELAAARHLCHRNRPHNAGTACRYGRLATTLPFSHT